jgi:SAM-dependent methyltransferase
MGEQTAKLAPSRDWPRYYAATADRPPRVTLVHALERFEAEPLARRRLAVDLGCGIGQDTRELLRRGWRVLAIDSEPLAIEQLRQRRLAHPRLLHTCVATFDAAWWPAADLVNASNALPFCPPQVFPAVWRRIVASLRVGGRFAGQFFGTRDSWAGQPDLTFHTRGQVLDLLADFEIELLQEREHEGSTLAGRSKHWHAFDVVARKIAVPDAGPRLTLRLPRGQAASRQGSYDRAMNAGAPRYSSTMRCPHVSSVLSRFSAPERTPGRHATMPGQRAPGVITLLRDPAQCR